MQYVGGKQKSGGAQIAQAINAMIKALGLRSYSEPFCGGLSVTQRVVAPERRASDACAALICLYQLMQGGWVPPLTLSKDEWLDLKAANDPSDPLTAFAGFGCSVFGGWFSSYTGKSKRTGDNYVTSAVAAGESLSNKLAKCRNVQFTSGDYRDTNTSDIIYCDPPYRDTLQYPAVGDFDSDAFWEWAREQSRTTLLAASEQQAPEDFVPVRSFSIQSRIAVGSGKRRSEHLYVHVSQLEKWQVAC
jgi:DNA adenine methylase